MDEVYGAERTFRKYLGLRHLPTQLGEEVADGGPGGQRDIHTRPSHGVGVRGEETNGYGDAT